MITCYLKGLVSETASFESLERAYESPARTYWSSVSALSSSGACIFTLSSNHSRQKSPCNVYEYLTHLYYVTHIIGYIGLDFSWCF